MDRDNRVGMDQIHLRIMRVTEDLRAIQQELNCAAMQAPTDPELMEALSEPLEIDSLNALKSALDQMRHFLWFYTQIMAGDTELSEKIRQSIRHEASAQREEKFERQFQNASDAIMLSYLAEHKHRKPN